MGEEVPSSPTNKVKFLCSHGGKILPRPIDNQLKYVGGETRVVSVSPDISFAELAHKITRLFEGAEVILKYQLSSEDLDTLVSVRSDEDLKYMLEEYYRQEREGSSRLRAFLFPATPIMVMDSPMDSNGSLEERYIDAINGIVRPTTKLGHKMIPNNPHTTFSVSSGCSSPKSPPTGDLHQMESTICQETIPIHNYQGNRVAVPPMHKVQSSPNLYNYNGGTSPAGNNPYLYLHHYSPIPHLHGYHSPKPVLTEPHKMVGCAEKLTLAIPSACIDPATKNPFHSGYNQMGYPPNRYHRGSGHLYDDNGN